MKIKTLLELVEVRTLVASVIPTTLGVVYSWYAFDKVSIFLTLMLLIALMSMQAATNLINDYFDYKSGTDGSDKADEKLLVRGDVKVKQIVKLIFIFELIAFCTGLVICSETSYWLMVVGIFGGMVSLFYASGPIPISNTPFGELFSGVTMGLLIVTTVVYAVSGVISINTILMSIPTTIFIGMILLTNNTCDIVEDKESGRKTLPIVIGPNRSEKLWVSCALALVIGMIPLYLIGVFPLYSLGLILVLFPYKSVKEFLSYEKNRRTKGRTMGLVIKMGAKYHILMITGLVVGKLM